MAGVVADMGVLWASINHIRLEPLAGMDQLVGCCLLMLPGPGEGAGTPNLEAGL